MTPTTNPQIEKAARAAFEQHVMDSVLRGKFLVHDGWEMLDDTTRAAWLSVVTAAIAEWKRNK